ncbi:hypothetical protein ACTHGU_08425 [Chitinophagaceae bacterium MMS25-I14]
MMYKIAVIFNFKHIDYGVDTDIVYTHEEAVRLVSLIRSKGGYAELYPEIYSHVKVSFDEAYKIAQKHYDKIRKTNPDNYGELTIGVHTPVYYSFHCRDFDKEKMGMTPGLWVVDIDKLDGHALTSAEVKEYRKLNYSFL